MNQVWTDQDTRWTDGPAERSLLRAIEQREERRRAGGRRLHPMIGTRTPTPPNWPPVPGHPVPPGVHMVSAPLPIRANTPRAGEGGYEPHAPDDDDMRFVGLMMILTSAIVAIALLWALWRIMAGSAGW